MDGGDRHADKTDMMVVYGADTVAGLNEASESILRNAAVAIAAMAGVERAINGGNKTAACAIAATS